jgi:predicted transcriptional regulator
MEDNDLITLTADIVAAHVSNNSVAISDVGNLVERIHEALRGLAEPQQEASQARVPVVSIRASVKPDYLVCMQCGKKQKTLQRHLQAAHGMTPEQYRGEYGLPRAYPMVAPTYSERRSSMAKASGFGRKKAEPKAAPAPAKRGASKPRGKKDAAPSE